MSSKKILNYELKKEDLARITQLRNSINAILSSEKESKKAAEILKIWLVPKEKSKT